MTPSETREVLIKLRHKLTEAGVFYGEVDELIQAQMGGPFPAGMEVKQTHPPEEKSEPSNLCPHGYSSPRFCMHCDRSPYPGKVYEMLEPHQPNDIPVDAPAPTIEVDRPRTDLLGLAYRCIPTQALRRIAKVFQEGIRYGEDSWRNGNTEWAKERFDHKCEHENKWREGDDSEDHHAKCAWYHIVMMILDEEGKVQRF